MLSGSSEPVRQFVFRRQPAVRRQMVDHLGQMLAEAIQQVLARQAALRHQAVDLVGAKRVGEIARRDLLVRAWAHPRIGRLAVAVLLEMLEQVAQSAADNAACRATGKHAAEAALENGAKTAKTSTKAAAAKTATTKAAANSARRGCRRRCSGRSRAAADVFDSLVGKQRQDRHGHRRHAAAGLCARSGGTARTVLHSVQYI